jgi:hypothetical protein
MSVFSTGSPVPSLAKTSWDPKRLQAFPTSLSDHLEICDTTSVKSFPLSALGKVDPGHLPLLPQSSTLATMQGRTADRLLDFTPRSRAQAPAGGAKESWTKSAATPIAKQAFWPTAARYSPVPASSPPRPAATKPAVEKKDDGNIFQVGLKFVGDTAGAALRGVGDVAGTVVGETIKNNPLALVSRGASGVAGMLGASKEVTDALSAVDKGSGMVGDSTKSAVRGVGEFGAGTVEGVTAIVADPLAAAKGIGIMATSGLDAVPVLGDLTSGAEALVRGTSLETIREEKSNNRQAIWNGIVEEHKAVEGRVGSEGAWIKAALDVGTIVKSGAVQGGKTAARAGASVADDAAQAAAKVAGKADEGGAATAKAVGPEGDLGKASRTADEPADLTLQRQASSSGGPTVSGAGPTRAIEPKVATNADGTVHYYTKAPKDYDASKYDLQVDALAQKIAADVRAMREVAPDGAAHVAETRTIAAEAKAMLERAFYDDRIDAKTAVDRSVLNATSWLVTRELKAHGVRLSKETQEAFLPYKVTQRTDDLGDGNSMTKITTEGLEGKGGAWTSAALISARRALEKKPELMSSGPRELKVYNAEPRDLAALEGAVDDMQAVAPKLLDHLGEVQFERFIDGDMARLEAAVRGTDRKVTLTSSGGTQGYTMPRDIDILDRTDETVVIKKAPSETGTKKLNELKMKYGKDIPDAKFRMPMLRGTIVHEVAHLLDRNGIISKADDSPFKQLEPGKTTPDGKDLDPDNFVSGYALTNPAEDFAETVRFVVELQRHQIPDVLGGRPLTDALRAKLLRASEAIGSDPAALAKLPGW